MAIKYIKTIKNLDHTLLNTLISFGVHIGDLYNKGHVSSIANYYTSCVRNDYFIIDLNKTVWYLKRAICFFKQLSLLFGRTLFYHSSIKDNFFLYCIMLYLIQYKSYNSFINYRWIPGFISNYQNCFIRYIDVLFSSKKLLTSFNIDRFKFASFLSTGNSFLFFRFLLLKLLYLTYEKTFLKRDWKSEFNRLFIYWKSFIFLKSFKSVFHLPDCLFLVNPSDSWTPIFEFSNNRKIPVIGLLDTSSPMYGMTYPIPSNDDSIALSLFFISIFINISSITNLEHFRLVYNKPMSNSY